MQTGIYIFKREGTCPQYHIHFLQFYAGWKEISYFYRLIAHSTTKHTEIKLKHECKVVIKMSFA